MEGVIMTDLQADCVYNLNWKNGSLKDTAVFRRINQVGYYVFTPLGYPGRQYEFGIKNLEDWDFEYLRRADISDLCEDYVLPKEHSCGDDGEPCGSD